MPIDDDLWRRTADAFPFARHLDAAEFERLRALCGAFLRDKAITGARGFEPTDEVRVAIAFQACLPALNLGLGGYADFVEVIVYPDQFLVAREHTDEAGVVHESVDALAGEAMHRGPVVLSWADARPSGRDDLCNVTIHEFVHKLDMADGEADGIPPLPARRRGAWETVLHQAYDALCDEIDRIERRIPRHIDPETERADRYYAHLPVDPYAATDPAEFFAVSGEAFFVEPAGLHQAWPEWYGELARFFRQDPLRVR